jgi:transcriptional regulator with XRE-family HTH domain
MGRGGFKPSVRIRKQIERAELARDAARLKRCGLTYRQIAKKLDCSVGQAHILIQEVVQAYLADIKEETAKWIITAIAELLMVSQEAWNEWERSKQNKVRTVRKTASAGIEITAVTETRCGNPRYLTAIRRCIESIAKLRRVFTDRDTNCVFEGKKCNFPIDFGKIKERKWAGLVVEGVGGEQRKPPSKNPCRSESPSFGNISPPSPRARSPGPGEGRLRLPSALPLHGIPNRR